jgi:hypothetical protein
VALDAAHHCGPETRTPARCQALEASTTQRSDEHTAMLCPSQTRMERTSWRSLNDGRAERQRQEGRGRREASRLWLEEQNSEGENPMSVTGMKQARKDGGGRNRQEGEKPWRRNVAGGGNSRAGS